MNNTDDNEDESQAIQGRQLAAVDLAKIMASHVLGLEYCARAMKDYNELPEHSRFGYSPDKKNPRMLNDLTIDQVRNLSDRELGILMMFAEAGYCRCIEMSHSYVFHDKLSTVANEVIRAMDDDDEDEGEEAGQYHDDEE